MFYLLGILCVAWTIHELMNLLQGMQPPVPDHPLRRASDHFQAWDQNGESLHVDQVRGAGLHPRRRASDFPI